MGPGNESWLSCEKTAVLQGGFLLASQLCRPTPLSVLAKGDWERVSRPVLQALDEVCRGVRGGSQDAAHWRKKLICILWTKILGAEEGADVDSSWQENPLFAAQEAFPLVSRAVLLELTRCTCCSRPYAELLGCLSPQRLSSELSALVAHVTQDSRLEDARFLLEVWRELWRGSRTGCDALDQGFGAQCACYTSLHADISTQAPKRLKTDPDAPCSAPCVASQLFAALREVTGHIRGPELSCLALATCLDTLCSLYAACPPSPLDLKDLTCEVAQWEGLGTVPGANLAELVQEAQRELKAGQSPCPLRTDGSSLLQALHVTSALVQSCRDQGLLESPGGPHFTMLTLKHSSRRAIRTLQALLSSDTPAEGERRELQELKEQLENMEANSLPAPKCSPAQMLRVAMVIIDHRLEGVESVAMRFVSDLDWASSGTEWINCLERNRAVFRHKDLLLKLLSTLAVTCRLDADMPQCTKLRSVILDVFSELPLECQNATLASVLASWGEQGLCSFLPRSFSEEFSKELNLAFNSIIQSGRGSSLSPAVGAVAHVALQNPEATLRRCCHLAVVNLGAHALLGRILRQLPGLKYQAARGGRGPSVSLLCSCLQETVWDKLSSAKEEWQFLQFVVFLMEQDGGEGALLAPSEVLRAFVLPQLRPPWPSPPRLALCLRVLLAALPLGPPAGEAHWLTGCSPIPLLFTLCLLLDRSCRCWEEPAEDDLHVSMESRELLMEAVRDLGELVGREVLASPEAWSRPLSWLHSKAEALDWTVRLRLHVVWGAHFKREVPSSLLEVCKLPEQEWCGLQLPRYGPGTGLLAWAECCCTSDALQGALLSGLALDESSPDAVTMFSKGVLLVLTQALPCCSAAEWQRLLSALRRLLASGQLHVPYSLEYVDFVPLLDLRRVADELRLSVLLLRVFQMLCSASCDAWLGGGAREHAARLYACTVRGILASLSAKLPAPGAAGGGDCGAELLFALTQLFCHVLHVQVMLRSPAQQLLLCALEVLTQCQAVLEAHPAGSSAHQRDNMRHFLTSISDNVEHGEMRTALRQKIAQL